MIDSELNLPTQIMLGMTTKEVSVLEAYAGEQRVFLKYLGTTLPKEAGIEEHTALIGQWVTYLPEQMAEKAELVRLMDQTLKDCLRPKPELVLRLRYGITTEGEYLKEVCTEIGVDFNKIAPLAVCGKCSLNQLGEIFGTTLESVRQIEAGAERRLKKSILSSQQLQDYIPGFKVVH